jgi:hypothetical protein
VRDFPKHNLIKNHLRASLKLETLDALMWISLVDIPIDEIEWDNAMLLWRI